MSIRSAFIRAFRWLFSMDPVENRPSDPIEVLYRSIHITAKCRYNASIRLARVGSFSFLTATILSLGLILIPLIQLSGIKIDYPERVLNCAQIFFAVSVLIYSVINSTAHYETRAKSLNDCGDKIKELSRSLRSENYAAKKNGEQVNLTPYNEQYSRISTSSENHSRGDYSLAILQAGEDYHITGLIRVWLNIKVFIEGIQNYVFPIILILAELIVVLDIIGVTKILTGIFNRF